MLTNSASLSPQRLPDSFQIDGETFAVLGPEESTKYLGRKVCYIDPHKTEFDNRVAKAWGAFSRHKNELSDRRHRLKDRLKLFDAVVTSTLLYGCETWTLRTDQEKRLRGIQRKMLRMVLNAKRRTVTRSTSSESEKDEEESEADELEPWHDFLKRTAQWTEEELEKAKLKQWLVQWRRRKWKWAAGLLDKDNTKWSAVATKWQPLVHSGYVAGRRQARPKKRWDQDFVDYLLVACPSENRHWHQLASDKVWWLSQTEAFGAYCSN